MTSIDSDVRAVRAALLPALERDLARPRPRASRRIAIPLAVGVTLASGTALAAATGIIFADPKPDPAVPAAAEWQYFSKDPQSPSGDGGPTIMRPRPEALARTNRALEAELLERGIVARCGEDRDHPLACYLASGDPAPAAAQAEAYAALDGADVLESSPDHYEIRHLTADEARRWLCEHPEWRREDDPNAGAC